MSDYLDRLHTELLRGYEPRRRRHVAPALAAVVAAAAVFALLLVGRDAPTERSVEPAPTVEALNLPTPEQFRPATTSEARALGEIAPPAQDIAAVPAPPASPGPESREETWFVWRDLGLVCLSADGQRVCGSPADYAAGRLLSVSRRIVFGLVPPDFVRAFIGEGFNRGNYSGDRELFSADVVNGLWQLPRPIDSPIYLRRDDGTAVEPYVTRRFKTEAAVQRFAVLRDESNVVETPAIFSDLVATQFEIGRVDVHLVHEDERFRAYVAVAPHALCVLTEFTAGGGSVSCDPPNVDRFAEEGSGPSVSGRSDGRALVSALLPDGSREVALRYENGTTQTLAVADNFAFAFVDKPVDAMTWLTPDGERKSAPVSGD